MKILLLITDLEIGGTPTVVRELAIRLSGSISVTVACLSRWGPVADQLRTAGIAVVPFNSTGAVDLRKATKQLVELIQRERFDTVFSFLIHANFVAAIASRFVTGVRFLQSIQTTQPTPRWHWRLQSIVHHGAECIIVPSPSAARAAIEWADVPAEKIVVIPNAVDVPSATGILPVSLRIQEDHGQDARGTIGFIGRLDPIKRVPDLLQAIAQLDDRFTLEIFGDGEDRPRIEGEIDRLHLRDRVTLRGTVASPIEALEKIDLLVLPSAAEGFGLVLIEAMAAGVPVVATNVAGIRDVVIDNQTGLLVPVASPGSIAAAIRRITHDRALHDRLIYNGHASVRQRFSWEIVLPRYKSLLLAP